MTLPIITRSKDALAFEDEADRVRILVSGAQTDGAYSVMEWTVSPFAEAAQNSFGAHIHGTYEETFMVLEGALTFLLGNQVLELEAGDLVAVPPKARHGYVNRSGAPTKLLVTFRPAGMEELFYRYRTDQAVVPDQQAFLDEAARDHASTYET